MRTVISIAIVIYAAISAAGIAARQPSGIAYYDADRLYDTLPSLFYDDRAYTPQGKYKWNGNRYLRKIGGIAAVVDSMALPVVALYGVENEQVVRDIIDRCGEDYSYVHRTLSTRNGLDFALLYWGDRLFIDRVESGFDYMAIYGSLDSRRIVLILCRYSSAAERLASKEAQDGDRTVIVMGRTDNFDTKGGLFRDATAAAETAGMGNALLSNGWKMLDRVLTDTVTRAEASVYARQWLLDERNRPAATFRGRRYAGGRSGRLPIYIYIR
ncbi:MAG: hypothetical protein K2F95_08250 [Alistipes sp.]|nr:hypothetical protein [Alistipes sp.]